MKRMSKRTDCIKVGARRIARWSESLRGDLARYLASPYFGQHQSETRELTMSTESISNSGRRILAGRVVSDKMDKTVAVEVIRRVKHPRYHKYVNRRNVFKAHDEENACKVDDIVMIQESRPLSRTKRWVVVERRGDNS
jgi:small subunit ribosomal protein S17